MTKPITCNYCGKTTEKREQARPYTARYCNADCYHAAHSAGITVHKKAEHITKTCEQCGGEFTRYLRPNKPKGIRFCSVECANKHQGEGRTKRHTGGLRRSIEKAHKLRKAGSLTIPCVICGFDRWVEIAHAIPASKGGRYSDENLFWLCSNHHRLFDHSLLSPNEVQLLPKTARVAYQSGAHSPLPSGPRTHPENTP